MKNIKNWNKFNEGAFGWDYPPGAANDPNAPWNQEDDIMSEYVCDLIIKNGDMNDADADDYISNKIDFSDFSELVDKVANDIFEYDGHGYPIQTEWEKQIRKSYDYRKAKSKIQERKNQEIAKGVYVKLKEMGFPKHFSDKIR